MKLLARLVHRVGVETVFIDLKGRYMTRLKNRTYDSIVELTKEQAERRVEVMKEIK